MVAAVENSPNSLFRRFLNSPDVPAFAHAKYQSQYSPSKLLRLVQYHRAFARKHDIADPYFNFAGKKDSTKEPYSVRYFADGTILKAGSLDSFSPEEMAAFLETQMFLYVERNTMGKGFPNRNLEAENELRKVMMSDFGDRVVVLLYKNKGKDLVPLAGVQAYWGSTNQTVEEYFANQLENDTSLSSFWATVLKTDAREVSDFIAQYANLKESNIVVMSRLFNQFGSVHKEYGSQQKEAAWLVMAALAEGIQMHAQETDAPQPEIVLYDTHTTDIQDELADRFGMQILANPSSVEPSDEVGDTILKWHYGRRDWIVTKEKEKPLRKQVATLDGYAGEILLGYHSFLDYLASSQQILPSIAEEPA
jgi:hypothetical protein